MPIVNPLEEIRNELHVSYSQITSFLNCSLFYFLHYIECRPQERTSIALLFGSAVHSSLELFFRSLKKHGRTESVRVLWERFEDCLNLDLDNLDIPVIYARDLPDRSAAVEMGKSLLETFHESIDLSGFEIVDVELPLTATLYTDSGQPTDFKLFGVIDLVLTDSKGELLVVDHKTASKAISQTTADNDNQLTANAYLLIANGYAPATSEINCRFSILRKLKKTRLEHVNTIRTPFHRKRFARIANTFLAAVENKIFLPRPSWRCNSCSHSIACGAWSS